MSTEKMDISELLTSDESSSEVDLDDTGFNPKRFASQPMTSTAAKTLKKRSIRRRKHRSSSRSRRDTGALSPPTGDSTIEVNLEDTGINPQVLAPKFKRKSKLMRKRASILDIDFGSQEQNIQNVIITKETRKTSKIPVAKQARRRNDSANEGAIREAEPIPGTANNSAAGETNGTVSERMQSSRPERSGYSTSDSDSSSTLSELNKTAIDPVLIANAASQHPNRHQRQLLARGRNRLKDTSKRSSLSSASSSLSDGSVDLDKTTLNPDILCEGKPLSQGGLNRPLHRHESIDSEDVHSMDAGGNQAEDPDGPKDNASRNEISDGVHATYSLEGAAFRQLSQHSPSQIGDSQISTTINESEPKGSPPTDSPKYNSPSGQRDSSTAVANQTRLDGVVPEANMTTTINQCDDQDNESHTNGSVVNESDQEDDFIASPDNVPRKTLSSASQLENILPPQKDKPLSFTKVVQALSPRASPISDIHRGKENENSFQVGRNEESVEAEVAYPASKFVFDSAPSSGSEVLVSSERLKKSLGEPQEEISGSTATISIQVEEESSIRQHPIAKASPRTPLPVDDGTNQVETDNEVPEFDRVGADDSTQTISSMEITDNDETEASKQDLPSDIGGILDLSNQKTSGETSNTVDDAGNYSGTKSPLFANEDVAEENDNEIVNPLPSEIPQGTGETGQMQDLEPPCDFKSMLLAALKRQSEEPLTSPELFTDQLPISNLTDGGTKASVLESKPFKSLVVHLNREKTDQAWAQIKAKRARESLKRKASAGSAEESLQEDATQNGSDVQVATSRHSGSPGGSELLQSGVTKKPLAKKRKTATSSSVAPEPALTQLLPSSKTAPLNKNDVPEQERHQALSLTGKQVGHKSSLKTQPHESPELETAWQADNSFSDPDDVDDPNPGFVHDDPRNAKESSSDNPRSLEDFLHEESQNLTENLPEKPRSPVGEQVIPPTKAEASHQSKNERKSSNPKLTEAQLSSSSSSTGSQRRRFSKKTKIGEETSKTGKSASDSSNENSAAVAIGNRSHGTRSEISCKSQSGMLSAVSSVLSRESPFQKQNGSNSSSRSGKVSPKSSDRHLTTALSGVSQNQKMLSTTENEQEQEAEKSPLSQHAGSKRLFHAVTPGELAVIKPPYQPNSTHSSKMNHSKRAVTTLVSSSDAEYSGGMQYSVNLEKASKRADTLLSSASDTDSPHSRGSLRTNQSKRISHKRKTPSVLVKRKSVSTKAPLITKKKRSLLPSEDSDAELPQLPKSNPMKKKRKNQKKNKTYENCISKPMLKRMLMWENQSLPSKELTALWMEVNAEVKDIFSTLETRHRFGIYSLEDLQKELVRRGLIFDGPNVLALFIRSTMGRNAFKEAVEFTEAKLYGPA